MTERLPELMSLLERPVIPPPGLADELWAHLEAELLGEAPEPPTEIVPLRRRRSRRVWALAVAAAVAVAAIALPAILRDQPGNPERVVTTQPTGPTTTTTTTTVPSASTGQWREVDVGALLEVNNSVWTGEEWILFGTRRPARDGAVILETEGAAFDPVNGKWRNLPPDPLSRATFEAVVWTGQEVLAWGGHLPQPISRQEPDPRSSWRSDGAAYDPDTDRWRPVATAPVGFQQFLTSYRSVWTGTEMILWGGSADEDAHPDAGVAYNPATDTWRTIAESPRTASGRCGCAYLLAWTGEEMLAVSISDDPMSFAYDPAADTWRTIAEPPAPLRVESASAWTGKELVMWGGEAPADGSFLGDGVAYDPTADAWRPLPESPLSPRVSAHALWTGREVLIIGGYPGPGAARQVSLGDGAAYDPARGSWTALPASTLPERPATRGRFVYRSVWTGREALFWGTGRGVFAPEDRAAASFSVVQRDDRSRS